MTNGSVGNKELIFAVSSSERTSNSTITRRWWVSLLKDRSRLASDWRQSGQV